MNINGNSIFMGAYAERRHQETLLNPKTLNVSDDRQTEITGKLKEAMQGIDRGNSQSVKVSISEEDNGSYRDKITNGQSFAEV